MNSIQLRLHFISQFSEFCGGRDKFKITEDSLQERSLSLKFVSPSLQSLWQVAAYRNQDDQWATTIRSLVGDVYLTDFETTEIESATTAAVESAPTSGHVDMLYDQAEEELLQKFFLHRSNTMSAQMKSTNGVRFDLNYKAGMFPQFPPFSVSLWPRCRTFWLEAFLTSSSPELTAALDASVAYIKQCRDAIEANGWDWSLGESEFVISNNLCT